MSDSKDTMNRSLLAGSFLILLGVALFLSNIGVVWLSWKKVLWSFALVGGAILIWQGFIDQKRGRVFWGSLVFFIALVQSLWAWHILTPPWFLWWPALSVSFGLALFVLYLYDPRRSMLLIPVVIFVGMGVTYAFWWWELIEWYEIRDGLKAYWPLILVLWGAILLFRPKRATL